MELNIFSLEMDTDFLMSSNIINTDECIHVHALGTILKGTQ